MSLYGTYTKGLLKAGDIVISLRDTVGDTGQNLLPCDGSAVDGSRYPDLVGFTENIPNYSATGLDYKMVAENPGTIPFVPPAWDVSTELVKLYPETTSGNGFGYVVKFADNANLLFISHLQQYYGGSVTSSGAICVYEKSGNDTFSEIAVLVEIPTNTFRQIGRALAVTPDASVVIATSSNNQFVYYFTKDGEANTWTYKGNFQPSSRTPASGDSFGWSCSISDDGNILAVGSNREHVGGQNDTGAVYVFNRTGDTWSEVAKIVSSDLAGSDEFGRNLVISGDGKVLAVYAGGETPTPTGATYIFTSDDGVNWTERQKLKGASNIYYLGKGLALSFDGSTIVVGAPSAYISDPGEAYIYTTTDFITWTEVQALQPANNSDHDKFGADISMTPDARIIAIGAEGYNANTNVGAVYAYVKNDETGLYEEQSKLIASTPKPYDYFARTIDVSSGGGYISVGMYDDDTQTPKGSVFVYKDVS